MFDIGFAELLLIAVVGLLIIGPQRLPETIRFISLWIGRLRRSFAAVRRDIEQEIGMDDIRRQLHNEEIMRSLESSKREIERAVTDDPPTEPPLEAKSETKSNTEGESETDSGKNSQ